MLTASRPTFTPTVGVAPSTTTMTLGAAERRFYVPYTSVEDLRSGLGIVNESDAWLTGRPYGLPGTAAIRFTQHQGHYDASMVGGGFGDADTVALTAVIQQIAEAQKAQQKALDRVAFWQAMMGGITVGSIVVGALIGIVNVVQRRGKEW